MEKDIRCIFLTCVPNGSLVEYYDEGIVENGKTKLGPLAPGKNHTEARFRHTLYKNFELLSSKPLRTKVLYWNENMNADELEDLEELREIYLEQESIN